MITLGIMKSLYELKDADEVKQMLDADFTLERYGLFVRFVNEDDAEFIVQLRTNPKLGRYIHFTSSDVEVQKEWIKKYKVRESKQEDFYFIFEKPRGTRLGVYRIYNINDVSFTIGSWVFSPQAPIGTPFLADIIGREIGFELFPDKELLLDVRCENVRVNRYHQSYDPVLLFQDDDSYYYSCSKENFNKFKNDYIQMFYEKNDK